MKSSYLNGHSLASVATPPPGVIEMVRCASHKKHRLAMIAGFVLGGWIPITTYSVIISFHRHIPNWLTGRLLMRIPQDIGLVVHEWNAHMINWTGIDHRRTEVAAAAVDLVAHQLLQNERGVPPIPRQILIPQLWREEKSTVRQYHQRIASANARSARDFQSEYERRGHFFTEKKEFALGIPEGQSILCFRHAGVHRQITPTNGHASVVHQKPRLRKPERLPSLGPEFRTRQTDRPTMITRVRRRMALKVAVMIVVEENVVRAIERIDRTRAAGMQQERPVIKLPDRFRL